MIFPTVIYKFKVEGSIKAVSRIAGKWKKILFLIK
ncbi:hypothetical protein BN2127_JRS1_04580 [Bacillus cereus]|nr:hypothetical protein BN2127_JRS1_04580 [Bacillus cereus]